ncbi:4-hydroxy-3-methylbut-2-enyl diphosphate reductase [Serpentinicella alkaliphila]|uniref:4-hydroxy-3-methylbut-2-enyl diphosphate reductase n=1 Tax=Serpentinicella alkaliphila TaxID=1734049 RepID=A0A4R2TDF5_9FIRM|nr:4-hydroxy-3-methylbut-2-enyl diphosphate reductase [Serpentinicella alkaliphila]QUH26995.1 4-hydroxy-3-methylbut-2-enyl diphosphate reductase [Serpentinicella alkaliphila]TCQ01490.1 4-hydroxy-3-methylbut-2-enyl diphosphate reductase [Serpentinicella alkaliphila]
MKVILAEHSGFCFGVEKAINTVFSKMNEENIDKRLYTLGPLIHNTHVVNELEKKGIKAVDDLDDISNGIIIIRSHGVPEEVYEKAKLKGLEIVDTTCPYVKRIQNIVKDYYLIGYTIIIVGSPDHPEVIGINGWCNNEAIIINSIDQTKNISFIDKICLVSQTTMPIELFCEISKDLENKTNDIKKFDTICTATKRRQDSTRNLAKEVDAMVVIGDNHSSNTKKLLEICHSINPDAAFLIQSKDELPIDQLKKYNVIGVTAGASAPSWIIKDIVEILKEI